MRLNVIHMVQTEEKQTNCESPHFMKKDFFLKHLSSEVFAFGEKRFSAYVTVFAQGSTATINRNFCQKNFYAIESIKTIF